MLLYRHVFLEVVSDSEVVVCHLAMLLNSFNSIVI